MRLGAQLCRAALESAAPSRQAGCRRGVFTRSTSRGGHVCSRGSCPFGEGSRCVGRRRRGGETGFAECFGTCESQSLGVLKDRIKEAELFLDRAGKRYILQADEALKEVRVLRARRQEELEAGPV